MTKNEIVARWLGWECSNRGAVYKPSKDRPNVTTLVPDFEDNYNVIHEAWIKFRDLKFNDARNRIAHFKWSVSISTGITYGTKSEAFDELVKGIIWYQSLNQKS